MSHATTTSRRGSIKTKEEFIGRYAQRYKRQFELSQGAIVLSRYSLAITTLILNFFLFVKVYPQAEVSRIILLSGIIGLIALYLCVALFWKQTVNWLRHDILDEEDFRVLERKTKRKKGKGKKRKKKKQPSRDDVVAKIIRKLNEEESRFDFGSKVRRGSIGSTSGIRGGRKPVTNMRSNAPLSPRAIANTYSGRVQGTRTQGGIPPPSLLLIMAICDIVFKVGILNGSVVDWVMVVCFVIFLFTTILCTYLTLVESFFENLIFSNLDLLTTSESDRATSTAQDQQLTGDSPYLDDITLKLPNLHAIGEESNSSQSTHSSTSREMQQSDSVDHDVKDRNNTSEHFATSASHDEHDLVQLNSEESMNRKRDTRKVRNELQLSQDQVDLERENSPPRSRRTSDTRTSTLVRPNSMKPISESRRRRTRRSSSMSDDVVNNSDESSPLPPPPLPTRTEDNYSPTAIEVGDPSQSYDAAGDDGIASQLERDHVMSNSSSSSSSSSTSSSSESDSDSEGSFSCQSQNTQSVCSDTDQSVSDARGVSRQQLNKGAKQPSSTRSTSSISSSSSGESVLEHPPVSTKSVSSTDSSSSSESVLKDPPVSTKSISSMSSSSSSESDASHSTCTKSVTSLCSEEVEDVQMKPKPPRPSRCMSDEVKRPAKQSSIQFSDIYDELDHRLENGEVNCAQDLVADGTKYRVGQQQRSENDRKAKTRRRSFEVDENVNSGNNSVETTSRMSQKRTNLRERDIQASRKAFQEHRGSKASRHLVSRETQQQMLAQSEKHNNVEENRREPRKKPKRSFRTPAVAAIVSVSKRKAAGTTRERRLSSYSGANDHDIV